MKSAAAQMATHRKLVKIACSVERLKKMIVKSSGSDPDLLLTRWVPSEEGPLPVDEHGDFIHGKEEQYPQWQDVPDNLVACYVNFANMFLYAGNATIKVVDKEPDPAQPKLVLPG